MKVKELIEILKQYPEEMIVAVPELEYVEVSEVRKVETFITIKTEDSEDYVKTEFVVII